MFPEVNKQTNIDRKQNVSAKIVPSSSSALINGRRTSGFSPGFLFSLTGKVVITVRIVEIRLTSGTNVPSTLKTKDLTNKSLLKAIRNFPYPFLWYGGNVRMHAKLFPSGDSFSYKNDSISFQTSFLYNGRPFRRDRDERPSRTKDRNLNSNILTLSGVYSQKRQTRCQLLILPPFCNLSTSWNKLVNIVKLQKLC